jgi:quercetin dioxygenase-like cupin family protein
MKKGWLQVGVIALASLLWITAGFAADGKGGKKGAAAMQPIIVTPDQVQWKEGPPQLGQSQMAVLEGDPAKKGFFVTRLKLPAGAKIAPHFHNNVERVTVISGKINLAMGEAAENPTALPAGSYFSLPPKTVHNAWVDEETVLQITTNGPWSMHLKKHGDLRSGSGDGH